MINFIKNLLIHYTSVCPYCICWVHIQYLSSTFLVALDLLGSRKKTPPLRSSKNFNRIWLCTISWYLLILQCNTPNSLSALRTDVPKNICVRKFKLWTFIRDNIRHQRCQVVYIFRMPLYPSISISQNHKKYFLWYLKIISTRVCKKIFLIKAKKLFCTWCPRSAVPPRTLNF